mmetsp:Transcript_159/g.399  ORF Transcript_159/g.399 Transcript_159/m.399 type:complete len:213 (-) Transcript_159:106-744(-)
MIFRTIAVVAPAIFLSVLQSNVCSVTSLSTLPSTNSGSRRDVLTRTVEAATVAAASSILALDASVARAAQEYQNGPDGMKYIITNKGSGPKPQRGQKIETSYTLWTNGFPGEESDIKAKQIDSSKKPIFGDQPFKVRAGVSQVIRGWDLTLIDMQEGETRKLIVPPELGYGDKGVGPIPGKATLYFEMTLTKVGPMEELAPEAKKWLEEHPL